MKHLLLVIAALVLCLGASASDPFNNYQWNKANHENKSGLVDEKPWFEWWYYKVVIPETEKAYYFVYGVVNPWDREMGLESSRSYIGFGDFEKRITTDNHYAIDEFNALYDQTSVSLPMGYATDQTLIGQVTDEGGRSFSWDIEIQKKWAFNAEGWILGAGLTDIEWYPAQADARCSGKIVSDGELVELKDAPCYQDRNWGTRFPEWWAWIVSNKFDDHPDTALSIGGGQPHVFGIPSFYEGVCIGLKHKGVEYKWRPMELDRVKVDINFGRWEITGVSRDRKRKITISAYAPPEAFMDLQFTTPEGIVFHDYEALLGQVDVQLYTREAFEGWVLIETLHSDYTGIEYGSANEHQVKNLFGSHLKLQ
ncbi:MAG: hypothetical protein KDD68_16340 [Bdellovibrionales bacterium]|nr:hypothetical protein [Bdellovibrionales bacterium]